VCNLQYSSKQPSTLTSKLKSSCGITVLDSFTAGPSTVIGGEEKCDTYFTFVDDTKFIQTIDNKEILTCSYLRSFSSTDAKVKSMVLGDIMQFKAGFNIFAASDTKTRLAFGSSQVQTYILTDAASSLCAGVLSVLICLVIL